MLLLGRKPRHVDNFRENESSGVKENVSGRNKEEEKRKM